MTTLDSLVPMVFVQSVSQSIAFYAKLGFDVGHSFTPPGDAEPSWAWLRSGGANLMITRASHPVDASQQAVIFCIYCDDVHAFWKALQLAGVKVGEIEYPPYHPGGQFRLADPDGFDISVAHR
jgi:catechol 2,3-dioxygenase-like lactoylglutathione lyase family enzyme